jgi:hypothetical protein
MGGAMARGERGGAGGRLPVVLKPCFLGRQKFLPPAMACATTGEGVCYRRMPALLHLAAGVATQWRGGFATLGVRRCYRRSEVLLP